MNDFLTNYSGLSRFVDSVADEVAGVPCPDCESGITLKVHYGDEQPASYTETDGGEVACPTCGRPVHMTVKWGETAE